ncbi:hypothetical protein [Neobacillus mesonae]|uniref:hypothetical protein n=1 Tax=Neobacillus mesonae TaxID=1193713 RepID=UPI00082D8805|nr:hypothetical protein [Neobacillus mesonae]
MKLIDELIQELIDISQEWNSSEISTDTRNLKLELLESQLEQLQIDFSIQPFKLVSYGNQGTFKQLLNQHVAKAKVGLNTLKSTDNKRKYNAAARHLISRKLYFSALNRSIQRSISAYEFVNKMQPASDYQIFILGGNSNE